MSTVKKAVKRGKEANGTGTMSANAMHRELMRLPNLHETDRSNLYSANDNDDFIASESDRQLLLIKYDLLLSFFYNLTLALYFL